MKALKEQIAYAVAQVLLEMETGFSWVEFKKIENHKKRLKYLEKHLKFLGIGSARAAFQLDPKHVIKIANTIAYDEVSPKGTAQNEMEMDVFTDPTTKPVVTAIYDYDPEYIWIVSEYAEVFDFDDFEREVGFNEDTFERAYELLRRHDGDRVATEKYIDKFVSRWKDKLGNEETSPAGRRQAIESIKEFEAARKAMTHPIVSHVEHLTKDNRIDWVDLVRIDHWGKTADGRLVVIDYGLSQEIADTHYGAWS